MPETQPILLYGSPTCPMVPTVRGILNRATAPFQYVDISRDPAARRRVMEINDGYASVPTLVFADGSTLTEPNPTALKAKLNTLGYPVPTPTLRQSITENPIFAVVGAGLLIFGLLDGNPIFILLGVGALTFVFLRDRFD